jgi:formate hydrogenlyase subunit 3/multisubunit Na+/H+ antiporter MnhD subunit
MFLSVFTIVRAAFAQGHPWIAALVLFLLAVIFVGIARLLLELLLGASSKSAPERESPWLVLGPAALAAIVLLLGVYIPSPLHAALSKAAASLGGSAP